MNAPKRWRRWLLWGGTSLLTLLCITALYLHFVPQSPVKAFIKKQIPILTQESDNYVTRTYVSPSGFQMTYYLYVPANYNPAQAYPVVLLLHGGGERATKGKTAAQNREVLMRQAYVQVWGPGYAANGKYGPDVQQHWPSFIVVPQVVNPSQWVDIPAWHGSYTLAPQPTPQLEAAMEILNLVQQQYHIDPHRRYITGLSMGGYGVWDAIERWPNYFAAAAPLAGAGDPALAARLVKLPIWAFHGTKDNVVPVSGSRDMIQAIEAAGGHPRYTEFPQSGHEIWDKVYATMNGPSPVPDFFSWLFSQRNPSPSR
jgi:predicted peptidase